MYLAAAVEMSVVFSRKRVKSMSSVFKDAESVAEIDTHVAVSVHVKALPLPQS